MMMMNTTPAPRSGSGPPRSGNNSIKLSTSHATNNKTNNIEQASSPNRQRRKSAGPVPYLLVILVVVATISFIHSVHFLQEGDDHVIHNSLKEFKQGRNQPKGPSTPTSPKMRKRDHADSAVSKATTKKTAKKDNNNADDDDPSFIDIQKESPIANPPLSDGNSTFGACLLVMDDNHRLVEWMAYHYHVLPLRFLIIAVDPRSRTSPTHVLNRWRHMGMYIEEWDDFKFLKENIAKNVVPDDAELQVKRDRHRIRQKNFYRECLLYSKAMNRTWTTLIDTDEFLTYNHKGGADFETWEQEQLERHKESRFADKTRIRPSQAPPTTAQAGALINYIWQERAAGLEFFQPPCISCPRLQFGAQESLPNEIQQQVPTTSTSNGKAVTNPDRLDTLRFRKHAHRQDFVKNGLSKSILDVSRVTQFPRIQSLHRPIKTICSAPWKDEWNSGLRINHYLGSWEAYSFRDDSRRGGERSKEGWAFKAQDADETDDNIRPWIGGFVETHGPDKTKELLKGAGLPRGFASQTGNWTIMFLDEILGMNETKGNDSRRAFDNFVRDFHGNNQSSAKVQYSFHDKQ